MPDPNSPHGEPSDGTDEFGLPIDGDPDDVVRAFLATRDARRLDRIPLAGQEWFQLIELAMSVRC
jgi:hypothetical protein